MKKIILLVGAVALVCASNAQVTVQQGAGLHLQPGSVVSVQDDLESEDDVTGEGIFVLNGTSLQTINFHGRQTGGVMIENVNNVQLSAPISITRRLVMNTGHLICSNNTLELKESATIDGGNVKSFIVTSATGEIRKVVSRDLDNYLIPLGNVNGYAPLIITSSGNDQHAYIEVSSQNKIHPNKPATNDYIQNFWTVNRKGIKGTLQVKAIYKDIEGKEDDLKGFYWNGLAWSDKQSQIDIRSHLITVAVAEGRGEIYAFNPEAVNDRVSRISVFPNPAQSTATLQLNSENDIATGVTVYDVNGHVVLMKQVKLKQGINRLNINVSGWAKGQYTIKVDGEHHGQVISLIKG